MLARPSSALRCSDCASPNVLKQVAGVAPLPPPRKSQKAREFLRWKRTGEPPAVVMGALMRCMKCDAVVALNPQNLALACPHCGATPFTYVNA